MHFLRLSVPTVLALTLVTALPETSSAQCGAGGGRSMMGGPGSPGMSANPMAMQSMLAARQMQMQAAMIQQAQLQAGQFQANQMAQLQSAQVAAAKQQVAVRQLAARMTRFPDTQLRANLKSFNPVVVALARDELSRRQQSLTAQRGR